MGKARKPAARPWLDRPLALAAVLVLNACSTAGDDRTQISAADAAYASSAGIENVE